MRIFGLVTVIEPTRLTVMAPDPNVLTGDGTLAVGGVRFVRAGAGLTADRGDTTVSLGGGSDSVIMNADETFTMNGATEVTAFRWSGTRQTVAGNVTVNVNGDTEVIATPAGLTIVNPDGQASIRENVMRLAWLTGQELTVRGWDLVGCGNQLFFCSEPTPAPAVPTRSPRLAPSPRPQLPYNPSPSILQLLNPRIQMEANSGTPKYPVNPLSTLRAGRPELLGD